MNLDVPVQMYIYATKIFIYNSITILIYLDLKKSLESFNIFARIRSIDEFIIAHHYQYIIYKEKNARVLRTLNLNSPTGGRAYGIPRKFTTGRSRTVLLNLPWTKPHFVLTKSFSVSTNKPSVRTSKNTRTHMHRQIRTFNRSVDMMRETHVVAYSSREITLRVSRADTVHETTEIKLCIMHNREMCYRAPSRDTDGIVLILMKVMTTLESSDSSV